MRGATALWRKTRDAVRRVASLVDPERAETVFEAPTAENFRLRFATHKELQFTAVTYNVLAQCNAFHPEVGECPREVLDWTFRKRAILSQIEQWDADLIALQEVERIWFEQELEPWFLKNGYEGIFFCKKPEVEEGFEEGVALVYKTSSFVRISSVCAPFEEFLEPIGEGLFFRHVRSLRDGFATALLHHRSSNKEVLVSGLQLYKNPSWPDARIAQIHVLCETIHSFLRRQSRPLNTAILFMGDFASFWKKWSTDSVDKWVEDRSILSGVYALLTEGFLDVSHPHHPYVRNHPGSVKGVPVKHVQFTTSNFLFESAYHRARLAEPGITKCTYRYKDVADFVFYTPGALDTVSTLRLPFRTHPALLPHHIKFLPIPNAHFPSSHLPIGATLTFRR